MLAILAQFGDPRLPARFWNKVIPEPNTGCWLWLGALSEGYGNGRRVSVIDYAHRVSYQRLVGEIPAGLELDHRCRNRCCVNPAHLEVVTHLVNVQRGDAGAHERAKTTCPRGHPYDESNTYWNGNERKCRTCTRLRFQGRRAGIAAAAVALVLLLGGCKSCRELGGGGGLDLPLLDVVYECAAADGRTLELCFDGGATELGELLADEPGGVWTCEPTPRHLGSCWHRCPSERGCNALHGCYCPAPVPATSGALWTMLVGARPTRDSCDSPQVMPALDCGHGSLRFDGCRWRCERELRQ